MLFFDYKTYINLQPTLYICIIIIQNKIMIFIYENQGKVKKLNTKISKYRLNILLCVGEGNGNPFQYSCLESPMDRGVWRATVHGVPKSRT